jgi:DNA mismatch repair ATPase MutL
LGEAVVVDVDSSASGSTWRDGALWVNECMSSEAVSAAVLLGDNDDPGDSPSNGLGSSPGQNDAVLGLESLNDDFSGSLFDTSSFGAHTLLGRHRRHAAPRLDAVMLSKEKLTQSLEALCQVECKFIIAVGNDQVLALDQHAVHERILLEQLHIKLNSELPVQHYVRAGAHQVCSLDRRSLDCINESSDLLARWGFQHFSLVHTEEDRTGLTLLKFHKLPLIENEALTVNDFLEFVEHAQQHASLPLTLQAPPAVQRILASKSCRTAVKFGDSLSTEECRALLRAVVRCAHPFQCAHGRPSIVPLLSLVPRRGSARRRIMMEKTWNLAKFG